MTFELICDLAGLWCAIACVLYTLQYQRYRRRDRRIEREIQKLYDWENEQSEPVYQILQIADMLGIELEENDGDN